MSKTDLVRYTMTHGEMLPSVMATATLSLTAVVYSLYAKQIPLTIKELEANPLVLPDNASLVIQYHQDGHRSVTVPLLSLNSDQVKEVQEAIEKSDNSRRPVVSYSYNTPDTGVTARLLAVFSKSNWECKIAANISYQEANFIYETLLRYKLTH